MSSGDQMETNVDKNGSTVSSGSKVKAFIGVDKDSSDDEIQQTKHITFSRKRTIQVRECKFKKQRLPILMEDALVAFTELCKVKKEYYLAKAERYRAKNVEISSSIKVPEYSVAKCMTVLNEIDATECLADDIYFKTMEKILDPGWREVFLSISSDRRKALLNSL